MADNVRPDETATEMQPLVSIIMGSKSDWPVMKEASLILEELAIPYEKEIVSAHRTPDWLFSFAEQAQKRGIKVIIAGAGGAAQQLGGTQRQPANRSDQLLKLGNITGIQGVMSGIMGPLENPPGAGYWKNCPVFPDT